MGLRAARTGAADPRGRARRPPPRCSATGSRRSTRTACSARGSPGARSRVGTAQAVLDYVIPYVNERVAFGEPISNRQAVAFAVANIAIELEGMRLAHLPRRQPRRPGQELRPRGRARPAAVRRDGHGIGSDGVQLLGGHGYVKEHPVERWYRDLRATGVMEGAVLV